MKDTQLYITTETGSRIEQSLSYKDAKLYNCSFTIKIITFTSLE